MKLSSLVAIIVNYNGTKDTLECINSLQKSTFVPDIIVVDNGSRKEEIIELKNNKSIIVIECNDNLGFAKANNAGIQYALQKSYSDFLLINNDTVCDPYMIERLVNQRNGEEVVVPYIYYYSDKNDLWYGGGEIDRVRGNSRHFYLKTNCNFYCSFATGCCMLLSRSIIQEVGYLPEEYFMYYEDFDYSLCLQRKRIMIKCVVGAALFHKVGRSSGGNQSAFSTYYLTRNRLNCIKKNKKEFNMTAYYFSFASRVVRMIIAFLSGNKKIGNAYFKAIRDHMKGLYGKTI